MASRDYFLLLWIYKGGGYNIRQLSENYKKDDEKVDYLWQTEYDDEKGLIIRYA
jgi:hypothetical protein